MGKFARLCSHVHVYRYLIYAFIVFVGALESCEAELFDCNSKLTFIARLFAESSSLYVGRAVAEPPANRFVSLPTFFTVARRVGSHVLVCFLFCWFIFE